MNTIIGLDIGGTKTAVVEGTFEGEILQRVAFQTEALRPFDQTFPILCQHIDQIDSTSREAGRNPAFISISIGGPLRIKDGVLLDPPHLPGWHGTPLKATLEKRYPVRPVYIEHDGNAGALAEYRFGVGKGVKGLRHLVFLTFGTGLGAGLIVNGAIVHGASDNAGEVGHWRLAEEGPVGFGKAGSWEGFASGAGLVTLASERYPQRWTLQTPIRDFVEAVLADDPEAVRVVTEAGRWMGRGVALLVDALNPQMVVLGSLGVVLGERILKPMKEVIYEEALPGASAACTFVPAALGSQIGDVASLMAAIVAAP